MLLIVLTRTGCTRVKIQNHVVRRQSWEAALEKDGRNHELEAQSQPSSSRFVHVDYSPEGAEAVLGFFLPEDAERLSKTRWYVMHLNGAQSL